MTPIRHWILAAVIAGLVAPWVAACGGADDEPSAPTVPPPAPAPKETSKLPNARPPQPPAGHLERFPDGAVRYTGTTEDGEKFSAQLGGDVTVPEALTNQVPLYPGAVPFSVMEAAVTIMITLDSPDDAAKIYDFYTQRLPEAGWNIENDLNVAGQRVLTAVRSDKKIVLQIDGMSEGSRIAIVLADAG